MDRGAGVRDRSRGWLGWGSALLLLALLPLASRADDPEPRPPVEVVTEEMSAEEMAKRLYPREVSGIRTRGIRITDEAEAPQTLGLPIQFGRDSAEIASASRARLDEVGRMLQMEALQRQRLRIEGHTDASGSAAYNRKLSERRAEAVASYLVDQHGISPDRIETGGRGEDKPLPGRTPEDPVNRRVELSAAGPRPS